MQLMAEWPADQADPMPCVKYFYPHVHPPSLTCLTIHISGVSQSTHRWCLAVLGWLHSHLTLLTVMATLSSKFLNLHITWPPTLRVKSAKNFCMYAELYGDWNSWPFLWSLKTWYVHPQTISVIDFLWTLSAILQTVKHATESPRCWSYCDMVVVMCEHLLHMLVSF